MLSRLSKWILNGLGWSVQANIPDLNKYVLIVAPHTSNWDFPLGLLGNWALRLRVHWMGKHSLFHWPYGWFFRATGGIPVHREPGHNYIKQMTDLFAHSDRLVLAIAPEGTRSRKDHWKTGFHYIARAANVPIVLAHLDFGHKHVGIEGMFYPGEDIEADLEKIREYYQDRHGKNPEKESQIQIHKK